MADFPTDLSSVTDNVDDVLAKHINNIEAKIGVDSSTVTTSLDYRIGDIEDSYTDDADTDVSSKGWVVDEDAMGSDLATKVPTQQSVKAYVDKDRGCAFRVNLSSNQTIPNDTWTQVDFDNVYYDLGSDYDTTNHNFVVPKDGYYFYSFKLNVDDLSAGDNCMVKITRGSTTVYDYFYDVASGANNVHTISGSFLYDHVATGKVEVHVYQDSGGDVILQSGRVGSNFIGFLIQGD